ncbi:MAG TPA: imidazole glycerol phosphate synthase subunit HisH [Saprospiraceae bacterium]|nr:imidazole glycerol phosphate synthase subunit HisH [Saprospiraceae bacterium]HNT19972.1 imidazole glycerol phosphate synthase subunit HisH [Saprospiraceae bacterium]
MKQKIAVIDYNAGNVQSVLFALERFDVAAVLTRDPDEIRKADKVLFPGVGEASTTMGFLRARGFDQLIPGLTQPVLGICLGLQLLCEHSEENDTACLGILPVKVKRFVATSHEFKIPHMGWNQLELNQQDWLAPSMDRQYVYFVHSYYAELNPYTVASCTYCQPFSAVIHKDNFYATQFHVEKSGPVGLKILETFLDL